jgi:hypothetical protein
VSSSRVKVSAAVAVASLATVAAVVPVAARGTTEPEVITPIGVRITDKAVQLSQNQVDRGAIVKFTVVNASKTTRSFSIGGRTSKQLKPKAKQIFFMNFDLRGDVTYRSSGARAKTLTGVFHVL